MGILISTHATPSLLPLKKTLRKIVLQIVSIFTRIYIYKNLLNLTQPFFPVSVNKNGYQDQHLTEVIIIFYWILHTLSPFRPFRKKLNVAPLVVKIETLCRNIFYSIFESYNYFTLSAKHLVYRGLIYRYMYPIYFPLRSTLPLFPLYLNENYLMFFKISFNRISSSMKSRENKNSVKISMCKWKFGILGFGDVKFGQVDW